MIQTVAGNNARRRRPPGLKTGSVADAQQRSGVELLDNLGTGSPNQSRGAALPGEVAVPPPDRPDGAEVNDETQAQETETMTTTNIDSYQIEWDPDAECWGIIDDAGDVIDEADTRSEAEQRRRELMHDALRSDIEEALYEADLATLRRIATIL